MSGNRLDYYRYLFLHKADMSYENFRALYKDERKVTESLNTDPEFHYFMFELYQDGKLPDKLFEMMLKRHINRRLIYDKHFKSIEAKVYNEFFKNLPIAIDDKKRFVDFFRVFNSMYWIKYTSCDTIKLNESEYVSVIDLGGKYTYIKVEGSDFYSKRLSYYMKKPIFDTGLYALFVSTIDPKRAFNRDLNYYIEKLLIIDMRDGEAYNVKYEGNGIDIKAEKLNLFNAVKDIKRQVILGGI